MREDDGYRKVGRWGKTKGEGRMGRRKEGRREGYLRKRGRDIEGRKERGEE